MPRSTAAKVVMFCLVSYGTATILAASAVLHAVERFRRKHGHP